MTHLDLETAGRFRAGETAAFERLINLYQDRLYRLGLRLFRSPADAQDFAQDVLVHVYERRLRYDHRRPFDAWFWTVAMNLGRQRLRRRKELLLGDETPELVSMPGADTELLAEERRQAVRAGVQALKPAFRQVLALRFETDLTLKEIGRALGISEGTVKSRLSRGLQAFHAAYAAQGGERP